MNNRLLRLLTLFFPVFPALTAQAQDVWKDDCTYSGDSLPWSTHHGDGEVVTSVDAHSEFIRFNVNTTQEPHNVWWAIVQRHVPFPVDQNQDYTDQKVWMEAKVRPSHAPRRINMRLLTQRPADDHAYLKEFDLADTSHWHTLRFSPEGLTHYPGDQLRCHLALIDWGNGEFHLDIKEVKVFFTPSEDSTQESENALVYHPEPRPAESFAHHLPVAEDATVDLSYPEQSLHGWGLLAGDEKVELLSVSYQLIPLLRWDFEGLSHHSVDDWGLLTLAIHSSNQVPAPEHEFGRIRIMEIIGGDENWTREEVTFDALSGRQSVWEVFNEQMIIDMDVPPGPDQLLQVPISPAVLQRLLDGKTKGLAVFPLGSIQVSFYSKAYQNGAKAATLYFD